MADTEAFSSWCVATERVHRFSKSKAKLAGEHLRSALRLQLALAAALGMTPMSRARLPAVKPTEQRDKREATIAALVR